MSPGVAWTWVIVELNVMDEWMFSLSRIPLIHECFYLVGTDYTEYILYSILEESSSLT